MTDDNATYRPDLCNTAHTNHVYKFMDAVLVEMDVPDCSCVQQIQTGQVCEWHLLTVRVKKATDGLDLCVTAHTTHVYTLEAEVQG